MGTNRGSPRTLVDGAIDRIVDLFAVVALLSLGVMAVLLLYDVVMRYVFHAPADWVLDVVQLVQVTLAFSAAAPVLRAGGHINMELLPTLVGKRRQRQLELVSNALCAAGCVWMVILSWRTFARSLKIGEAAYGIALPIYPWKFLVPLCFAILALQFIAGFLRHWREREEGASRGGG